MDDLSLDFVLTYTIRLCSTTVESEAEDRVGFVD